MNDPAPSTSEPPAQPAAPAAPAPTNTGRGGAAFAWLVCLLALGYGFAQVYPMLADGLTSEERVSVQVAEAQAERVRRGMKPLVLSCVVQGEVTSIDQAGVITVWGTAWPEKLPDGMLLDEVESYTPTTSTLVVRGIDPASVTVGKGSRGTAFFVERRLVPNRAGQPPLYEWVFDMEERAALKRLRQRAAEGR